MKTSSAKAKGRRLQQWVRDRLREIGVTYGLEDTDIESRGMGQNGTDIALSSSADRVFHGLAVECKNVEKLNIPSTYRDHAWKYLPKFPILVHSRNRSYPLVTLSWDDFERLFRAFISHTQGDHNSNANTGIISEVPPGRVLLCGDSVSGVPGEA